jgi:hypothetical protein
MAAARVLPQPPAAALAGWLPSRGHPSDHLAVVADLEWLPGGAAAGARPPRAEDEGDGEPAGAGPHGGCAAPRGADGLGAGQPRAPAPRASCSKGAAGSGGAGGAAVSGPAPRRRRPPSAGAVSCEAGGPGSGDRPPAGEPAGAAGDGRPADGAPAGPGPSPGAGGNGAIAGGRAPMPVGAPGAAAAAAAALAGGGVIAVPTDTLYGLACDAASAAGVAAIYAIKARPGAFQGSPGPAAPPPCLLRRALRGSWVPTSSAAIWQVVGHEPLPGQGRMGAMCATPDRSGTTGALMPS